MNRKLVALFLARAGHRFDMVENGYDAIAAVSRARYDAVLMDIQMPDLDGLAATRKIRGLPGPTARVPVIALTANAMKGYRDACLEAGMNDYVSKPIDPEALQAALARQTGIDPAPRADTPAPGARAGAREAENPIADSDVAALFAAIETGPDGR